MIRFPGRDRADLAALVTRPPSPLAVAARTAADFAGPVAAAILARFRSPLLADWFPFGLPAEVTDFLDDEPPAAQLPVAVRRPPQNLRATPDDRRQPRPAEPPDAPTATEREAVSEAIRPRRRQEENPPSATDSRTAPPAAERGADAPITAIASDSAASRDAAAKPLPVPDGSPPTARPSPATADRTRTDAPSLVRQDLESEPADTRGRLPDGTAVRADGVATPPADADTPTARTAVPDLSPPDGRPPRRVFRLVTDGLVGESVRRADPIPDARRVEPARGEPDDGAAAPDSRSVPREADASEVRAERRRAAAHGSEPVLSRAADLPPPLAAPRRLLPPVVGEGIPRPSAGLGSGDEMPAAPEPPREAWAFGVRVAPRGGEPAVPSTGVAPQPPAAVARPFVSAPVTASVATGVRPERVGEGPAENQYRTLSLGYSASARGSGSTPLGTSPHFPPSPFVNGTSSFGFHAGGFADPNTAPDAWPDTAVELTVQRLAARSHDTREDVPPTPGEAAALRPLFAGAGAPGFPFAAAVAVSPGEPPVVAVAHARLVRSALRAWRKA